MKKKQIYDGTTHFEGCHNPKDPQHSLCKPISAKSAEEIAGGLPLHTLGCLRSPSGICVCIAKDLIAQALRNFAAGESQSLELALLRSSKLIDLQSRLLVCYRTGSRPSEKLLDELIAHEDVPEKNRDLLAHVKELREEK